MYTCGIPDKFEYRRYSVLGYLVLIITKFGTFMYLVSEIYLIGKTDINVKKLVAYNAVGTGYLMLFSYCTVSIFENRVSRIFDEYSKLPIYPTN